MALDAEREVHLRAISFGICVLSLNFETKICQGCRGTQEIGFILQIPKKLFKKVLPDNG